MRPRAVMHPATSRATRLRDSAWILPSLAFGIFTWVSFLIIGLRSRRRDWLGWAAGYGVLAALIIVGLLLSPEEADSALASVTGLGMLAVWIGGFVHAVVVNRAYLRWRAGQPNNGSKARTAAPASGQQQLAGVPGLAEPFVVSVREDLTGHGPSMFVGLSTFSVLAGAFMFGVCGMIVFFQLFGETTNFFPWGFLLLGGLLIGGFTFFPHLSIRDGVITYRRYLKLRCRVDEVRNVVRDRSTSGEEVRLLDDAGESLVGTIALSLFNRADMDRFLEMIEGARHLSGAGVTLEQAASYPARFEPDQVARLAGAGVAAEDAAAYPARFDDSDVVCLVKGSSGGRVLVEGGVAPALAGAYPSRFGGAVIVDLVAGGVSPEQAASYPERFAGWVIAHLAQARISPERAARYPERFEDRDVADDLLPAGVTPEQAAAYPARFGCHDLIRLVEAGVGPEQATAYPQRLSAWVIADLVKSAVSPEEAARYPERFDDRDIADHLLPAGVTPEQAAAYPERLAAWEIASLVKARVPGDLAAAYAERFRSDIAYLLRGWVPRFFDRYGDRSFELVTELLEGGVSPAQAGAYPGRFDGADIVYLVKAGVSPEQAASYDERFSGDGIACLVEAGVTPEQAAAYPGRFDGWYVARLLRAGFRPDQVERRSEDFSAGWPCLGEGDPPHYTDVERVEGGIYSLDKGWIDRFHVDRCRTCGQLLLCHEHEVYEEEDHDTGETYTTTITTDSTWTAMSPEDLPALRKVFPAAYFFVVTVGTFSPTVTSRSYSGRRVTTRQDVDWED